MIGALERKRSGLQDSFRLVSCPPCVRLQGEKRSCERSRNSWAYSPKRWKTNQIVSYSVAILYSTTLFLFHSSIHTSFEPVFQKIFRMLLGYTVAKAPICPRNSIWFTRAFLLVRGWGMRTRLISALWQIGHPALEQNVLGVNWSGRDKLPTTAGPLTVILGLSLATYCSIVDDGMMTVTLAAVRDP